MPKWTDYTIKTEPADNDEVMVLDTAGKANKRLGLSALSDWILDKLADKVFQKLETNNKTVLGAINELNGGAFLPKAELRTSADSAEPGAYRVTDEHPVDGETEAVLLCFKIFNNDWGLFTQFLIPRGGGYIKARTCWYKTWENWKKYNVDDINEANSKTLRRVDDNVEDWNNIASPGIYSGNASASKNSPIEATIWINAFVVPSNGNVKYLTAYAITDKGIFFRNMNDGRWETWIQIK